MASRPAGNPVSRSGRVPVCMKQRPRTSKGSRRTRKASRSSSEQAGRKLHAGRQEDFSRLFNLFFEGPACVRGIAEIVRRDMRYTAVNRAMAALYGLKPEQVIGRTMIELGVPREAVADGIKRLEACRGRDVVRYLHSRGKNDEKKWYDMVLTPLGVGPNGLKQFVFEGRDVTRIIRAQSELELVQRLSSALNSINDSIHSSLGIREIMQALVSRGAEALGCRTAAISMREEGRWVVRYVHGFSQDMVGAVMTDRTEGHALKVLETGRTVAVADSRSDPSVKRRHMLKYGVLAVLVVPLFMRGRVAGVLFLNFPEPRRFRAEEIRFGEQLATSAGSALERGLMFAELERAMGELNAARNELEAKVMERTAQLHALTVRMIGAEEKERYRMGQVLHEDLQQTLVSMKYELDRLRSGSSGLLRKADLAGLAVILDKAIGTTRSLSADLVNAVLCDADLADAFAWAAKDAQRTHGLSVRVSAAPGLGPADHASREFMFRSVKELLLNVAKHSGVRRASIRAFAPERGLASVEVSDRGSGFDPARVHAGSIGLSAMRERAAYLGGELRISSTSGRGTRVTLTLPV
ncbi:MAG: GAF domain-containing protein [Lentisphaerae bacterium]|nr:GAF domain-containing protein [Lentisphaerota bacterium]